MTVRIKSIEERHLGEDADDEAFARAMGICEGYPPSCSSAFACLHDGECFRKSPHLEAARSIETAARAKSGRVRDYMLKAAQEIRAGRIYLGADIKEFSA